MWLVTTLPSGSGAPPGRLYDRPARSSLNRPAATRFGKRGPELRRRYSAECRERGAGRRARSQTRARPTRPGLRPSRRRGRGANIGALPGAPLPSGFVRREQSPKNSGASRCEKESPCLDQTRPNRIFPDRILRHRQKQALHGCVGNRALA